MSQKGIDINIKVLKKEKFQDLQSSSFVFNISGKTVNTSIVNALRRMSLLYVPKYAMPKEVIQIEKNESIYDNDYMRLRLSQMDYPNLESPVDYLEDEYWSEVNYADPSRPRHPNDTKDISMYVNVTNNTEDTINVTTNDVTIIEDGKEVKKFDKKYPFLLLHLRPGNSFIFKGNFVLGCGYENDIFAAANNAYYKEIDPNQYVFTLEASRQMDEVTILHKACRIMIEQLDQIKFYISDIYNDTKESKLEIRLMYKDHTIGNVLNEFLQDNPSIAFSGLSKPDLLINEIVIKLISIDSNPLKPVFKTIDYIIEVFETIDKKIK